MALSDYQFSYRGVTMGVGTNYDVIDIRGLHDLSVRSDDRESSRSHGYIPGIQLAGFRLIRMNIMVHGTAGSLDLWTDVSDLLAAMSPDQYEQPSETGDRFQWKLPGETEVFSYVRPAKRTTVRRSETEGGLVPINIELRSYDPRIYSAAESNSGTETITFVVTNNGNALAYPILEFDPDSNGDCSLRNGENGSAVTFEDAGTGTGLTLDLQRWVRGRGDLLIAWRTVALNYYPQWQIPREPLTLVPGDNQLWLDTGDSVIVKHRDTWM